jgi:hypothetical protein
MVVLSDEISMGRFELLTETTPVLAVASVGDNAKEALDTGSCEPK